MTETPALRRARFDIPLLVFGTFAVIIGLTLAAGGTWLVALGGSRYYLLTGVALVAVGILYSRRDVFGAWLYLLVYMATLLWSYFEVGASFWPLVPRIVAPTVLGFFAAILAPRLRRRSAPSKPLAYGAAGLTLALFLVLIGFTFVPHEVIQETASDNRSLPQAGVKQPSEWRYYGRDGSGTRFAPYDQITKENVKDLKVAWVYHSLDPATGGGENEDTPIQIGDTLYSCTANNVVFALDLDTGKQKWRFDPQTHAKRWKHCRGVGFYEGATAPHESLCATRIVFSTIDARLLELDAETGRECESFGNNGTVDLRQSMGDGTAQTYYPTSMPTVVDGLIIVGGYVRDNQAVGEPSGVVRAFDAKTGALVWAWNAGKTLLPDSSGRISDYDRGTPNVWSTPSFDESLGLLFLPTGNPSPDFFGGMRSEADNAYSSSVVALDIKTGQERWHYQTVHHDLWDYDVPSQPTLADAPDQTGASVPAIFIPTKRGQIFVLNRRTGKPVTQVEERPAPQGSAPGDYLSATQPQSVEFPTIGAARLNEQSMWGATPFDQLYCRIRFRQLRYEGEFTPPGLTESLDFPGHFGGFNWGSASIDPTRGTLVINDIRVAQILKLVPRAEAEKLTPEQQGENGLSPMSGTPYAIQIADFMSPLGIPCQAPPWGTLTGIDIAKRRIAWQVPMGTSKDTGPLGFKTGLSIPIGMPTIGGPLTTATGVTFFAGTQDFYIRALETATGRLLWKDRLAVGAGATPMTYVSAKTGKQYVVVSTGGSRDSDVRGDALVAYALPN